MRQNPRPAYGIVRPNFAQFKGSGFTHVPSVSRVKE